MIKRLSLHYQHSGTFLDEDVTMLLDTHDGGSLLRVTSHHQLARRIRFGFSQPLGLG